MKQMNKWIWSVVALGWLLIGQCWASDEDWLKNEVLKQISELRQDNTELHKEVDTLKKAVAAKGINKGSDDKRTVAELKGNKPVLGSPTAKVLVVEFTDFQCPFCRKFGLNTFPQVKEQFVEKGLIQYVVRDFPLGFHDKAKQASLAANCAGKQNAYWDMKQKILGGQESLAKDFYTLQAKELKLNVEKFEHCLGDKEMLASIDKGLAYANSIGIQATPSFLIGRIDGREVKNIKAVSGAMTIEAFGQTVESLLKSK